MLDWTGERFVPWAKEAAVAYEHLHRYIWASTLVRDRRVLDLASGEGYGSNLLAGQAAYVCGVDIDDAAVSHSSAKYKKANLEFLKGSITSVPVSESQSFDVIVCFEAIEHIEDHVALLREVKRLLKPQGIFIVSTPNKEYESGEEENPFHVKELSFDEFNALLQGHFANVCYLGQRLHPASSLWPLEHAGTSVQEYVIERRGEEFVPRPDEKRVARYFVGIVSDAQVALPSGSVLLDYSDEITHLLNERDRALDQKNRELVDAKTSAEEGERWFKDQLKDRDAQLQERDEALAWRDSQLREKTEALQWRETQAQDLETQVAGLGKDLEWSQTTAKDLEATVASRDEALAWREVQVKNAETDMAYLREHLDVAQGELGLRNQELAEIYQSRGWKMLVRLRRLFGRGA